MNRAPTTDLRRVTIFHLPGWADLPSTTARNDAAMNAPNPPKGPQRRLQAPASVTRASVGHCGAIQCPADTVSIPIAYLLVLTAPLLYRHQSPACLPASPQCPHERRHEIFSKTSSGKFTSLLGAGSNTPQSSNAPRDKTQYERLHHS